MFGSALIRRSFGWILTLVLAVYGTHYIEYHPEFRAQLHVTSNIAVVILTIAAVAALMWALVSSRYHAFKVVLAFVLGLIAASLGQELFRGNIAFFAICILGGALLYVITIAVDLSMVREVSSSRVAVRRPASATS